MNDVWVLEDWGRVGIVKSKEDFCERKGLTSRGMIEISQIPTAQSPAIREKEEFYYDPNLLQEFARVGLSKNREFETKPFMLETGTTPLFVEVPDLGITFALAPCIVRAD